MPDVGRGLRPPERGLVRDHPTEGQLLHVLHRALQQQCIPLLPQEWRPIAVPIADRHRHPFVKNTAEHVLDDGSEFRCTLAPDHHELHAVRGVARVVQLDHLVVEVQAPLLRLISEDGRVPTSDMERMLGVGTLVHDADIAPPRARPTTLELRVHGVDLTVGAVLRQQRLVEETREAVQSGRQLVGLDLEHVVRKVAHRVRVGHAAVLLDEFVVLALPGELPRAGEEHVLEEVGEAGEVPPLVAHAHVDAQGGAGLVATRI
mmetsp:Transcript_51063/g.143534  ORF Transcript_51063/g.143534 Transcript_51063/m.143534 type:complete len:261 (-) Transcript_51063:198-980(-)